jgi:hypothetical protein
MSARRLPSPLTAGPLSEVLLYFLVSRSLLAVIVALALHLMPQIGSIPRSISLDGPWRILATPDAVNYLHIARDGYRQPVAQQSIVDFPPLLPLTMRVGGLLTRRNDDATLLMSGALASNLAFLAALILLGAVLRQDCDRQTSARAVLYLLLFPTSIFFSMLSNDALFLLLAVGAFAAALKRHWLLSGLLGGLSGLSRPEGVLLVVPLILEYLVQRQFNLRAVRLDICWLLLVPLCLLAYLGWSAGDPLGGFKLLQSWRLDLLPIWSGLQRFPQVPGPLPGEVHPLVHFGVIACLAVLIIACWRRLRASYSLFATIVLLTCVYPRSVGSLARCVLPIFPVFAVLGGWGSRPWFDRIYLVAAGGFSGLVAVLVAGGYWPD